MSDTATIVAGEPYLGDVAFATITDGRAPLADGEVALGRGTLDQLGVGIGDTATLTDVVDPGNSHEFEVVGEVVLNDGLSAQPGEGALLTIAAFDEIAPDNLSQSYAVWIDQDVDREATLDALQRRVPVDVRRRPSAAQLRAQPRTDRGSARTRRVGRRRTRGCGARPRTGVVGPSRSSADRRAEIARLHPVAGVRFRGMARLDARRRRRWSSASRSAVVAGRVTWSFIADDLGVVSGPVLPVGAIAVITGLVLVVANLAALGPGLSAAPNPSGGRALRTE